MTEFEGMLIYKYVVFSSPVLSKEIWCIYSEEIDLHLHGKKNFHSFYAFELMIHFLVEEDFLNMHSDIFLNLTPAV